MKFIETSTEFNAFLTDYELAEQIILLPIPTDHKLHPVETKLSVLFVMLDDKSYALPFEHTDGLSYCSKGDLNILKNKNFFRGVKRFLSNYVLYTAYFSCKK